MYFPFKTLWRWYCLVIESVQQTAEFRFLLNSHNHFIAFRNKPTEKRQLKQDKGMRKGILWLWMLCDPRPALAGGTRCEEHLGLCPCSTQCYTTACAAFGITQHTTEFTSGQAKNSFQKDKGTWRRVQCIFVSLLCTSLQGLGQFVFTVYVKGAVI